MPAVRGVITQHVGEHLQHEVDRLQRFCRCQPPLNLEHTTKIVHLQTFHFLLLLEQAHWAEPCFVRAPEQHLQTAGTKSLQVERSDRVTRRERLQTNGELQKATSPA